jgi:hypothetical protein
VLAAYPERGRSAAAGTRAGAADVVLFDHAGLFCIELLPLKRGFPNVLATWEAMFP